MTKKPNDILLKGNELIDYIKRKIEEGNVRRVIIKTKRGKKVLEIPLTAGVGVGGVLVILAPVLVIISSVAAWLAEFRVEIIRTDDTNDDANDDTDQKSD